MYFVFKGDSFVTDENEAEMAEKADDGDDGSSSGGESDDDEGPITEIRFVPGDKTARE